MARIQIVCTMCDLPFWGRNDSKTCSPRCRKRRERVTKGIGGHCFKMGIPPNPKRNHMWR